MLIIMLIPLWQMQIPMASLLKKYNALIFQKVAFELRRETKRPNLRTSWHYIHLFYFLTSNTKWYTAMA